MLHFCAIRSRLYNGSVFNKQLHVLLLLVLISQFNNISNHFNFLATPPFCTLMW